MIICPLTRTQLLSALPRNATIAELGVAQGVFSQEIVRSCEPKRLFLVDPWEQQAREDYQNDANNAEDDEQERRYRSVTSMFADNPQVTVMRTYSTEAAATFADGALDWVYVDAVHSYEGALSDLRSILPKVTEDGLILGHDFSNHPEALAMGFGVIEAVETFIEESGCKLLLITDEVYPTFVLAKNPNSHAARQLVDAIYYNVPHVIEFEGPPTRFRQRVVAVADRTRIVNGFAVS